MSLRNYVNMSQRLARTVQVAGGSSVNRPMSVEAGRSDLVDSSLKNPRHAEEFVDASVLHVSALRYE
jgi:hypothetical protein